MIEDIMSGYNGTIFAYGPTGSGKTTTMFGNMKDEEQRGVIPRAVQHIFSKIKSDDIEVEYVICCSMMEIYRENLSDLLNSSLEKEDLKIKESPAKGIYIQGLTQIVSLAEHSKIKICSTILNLSR